MDSMNHLLDSDSESVAAAPMDTNGSLTTGETGLTGNTGQSGETGATGVKGGEGHG